jgi:hypothetical protein
MLAEIASKREDAQRARAEQTRRAAEDAAQRTQPATSATPATARPRLP